MNFRLILVAQLLFTPGTTIAATSYFKIYDTVERIFPSAGVLPIQANSSSDFYLNYGLGALPPSQKALVLVAGSQELKGILNSTLNYNSTMIYGGKNITISVFCGNQNISASERTWTSSTYNEPIAVHTFDLPTSWWDSGFGISKVSFTNPENYPVCWVVNVMLYGQVINNNWLTASLIGLVFIIIGAVTVGIAVQKSRPSSHTTILHNNTQRAKFE